MNQSPVHNKQPSRRALLFWSLSKKITYLKKTENTKILKKVRGVNWSRSAPVCGLRARFHQIISADKSSKCKLHVTVLCGVKIERIKPQCVKKPKASILIKKNKIPLYIKRSKVSFFVSECSMYSLSCTP